MVEQQQTAEQQQTNETYRLVGADGKTYTSPTKGSLGGHRGTKIYGRLDCPAALRAIRRGGYVRHRVFFIDSPTTASAGYRPCAVCMPDAYRAWRQPGQGLPSVGSSTKTGICRSVLRW